MEDKDRQTPDSSGMAAMFSGISPRYDLLNSLLSLGLDRRWRRALVQEAERCLTDRPGACVLDLAAGTLEVSIALCGIFSQENILALDLSPAMLAAGRTKLDPSEQGRISPVAANALALPVKSASLAAVLSAFGLRNMRPREQALAEIARVLEPGGHVFILEFSCSHQEPWPVRLYLDNILPFVGGLMTKDRASYRYLAQSARDFPGPAQIQAELGQAGFRTISWKRLFPGLVFLYAAEKA